MKYHNDPVIHENRKKWLEQLRKPESEKTYSKLERYDNPNARCCLGHACHALGIEREEIKYYGEEHGVTYGNEHDVLPKEAAEMLDITLSGSIREEVRIDGFQNGRPRYFVTLTTLNDKTELTPQQIADIIEDLFLKNGLYKSKYRR